MKSLTVQFNVILALIIKELQVRFGTKKLGYFWVLIEPILHIVPFFLIRKILGNWKIDELLIFLVTGIIAVLFFTKTATKIQASISANRALFMYRPVKPFDVALSRLFIECMISFAIFALVLGIFALYFEELPRMRILPTVTLTLIMFVVMALSAGVILMVAVTRLPFLEGIVPTVMRFVYFASGAFFSVSDVPYSFRNLLLTNPVLHVVEILRFNMMQNQTTNHGNPVYVMECAFLMLGLATALYFINKNKLV